MVSDLPPPELGKVTTPSKSYTLPARDPYVRVVDTVTDFDGCEIQVGVDYDTVTISPVAGPIRLDRVQAEEFARAFVSACWTASAQATHLG